MAGKSVKWELKLKQGQARFSWLGYWGSLVGINFIRKFGWLEYGRRGVQGFNGCLEAEPPAGSRIKPLVRKSGDKAHCN